MKIFRFMCITLTLFACLALFIPLAQTVKAAPDGWEWQGPASQGKALYGVWGNSSSDAFAVGEDGVILHYDGSEWTAMDSGVTDDINDVWASGTNDVYAVTQNGDILHYDGGGWTSTASGTSYLYGIWGTGPSDIFATGYMSVVHYDGTSWTTMTGLPTVPGMLLDAWGSASDDVFVVGVFGAIIHYDGTDWTQMDSGYSGANEDIWGVWGTASNDVYAASRMGVLKYDGIDWSLMSGSEVGDYRDIWGSSSTDIYAVGLQGKIVHYDGSWTEMFSGAGAGHYINGVWGTAGNDIIAVGKYGMIVHYDGNDWLPMRGGAAPEFLLGVWGSSSNDIYAVGSYNNILHYDGTCWAGTSSGTTNRQLNDVWGSSSSDVFVVGLDGLILHYNGIGWTEMDSGTSGSLFAVWGASSTDVHAIGSEGTMLHYDGVDWTNIAPGGGAVMHGLWGSSSNNVYAAGAAGRIYHYDGGSWTQVITGLGGNYNAIWGSSANDIFFVGDGGTIIHFDGTDWAAMTSNTTDNLYGVWGNSPTQVYAVGESGLYAGNVHYYDGTGWTQVDTGLGALGSNSYRSVWGVSLSDMYAVGSLGAIIHQFPVPQTLTLSADPISIEADGSSVSTLTAAVLDQADTAIPDGTEVQFATNHGTLGSSMALTSGGEATTTLTSESGDETVIATVTATANGASDVVAVFFIPAGGTEVTESQTETVTDSGTIDDTLTGGDVSIDATGDHTITIAVYDGNPGGSLTFNATGDYYDVHLDDNTGVNSVTVTFCPAEEDTVVYYWNGTDWVECSDQTYTDGCIEVTITDSTEPALSDLTGLIFGLGAPMGAGTSVGGEVYSINKATVLMPWLGLGMLLVLATGGLILARRRSHR
jgi:hypothetical protein